jgi:hypothetical protein
VRKEDPTATANIGKNSIMAKSSNYTSTNNTPDGFDPSMHTADVEGIVSAAETRQAGGLRVLKDLSAETLILQRELSDRAASEDAMTTDVRAVADLMRADATYFDGECKGYVTETICRDNCFRALSQKDWNLAKLEEMRDEMRALERMSDTEIERVNVSAKVEYMDRLRRAAQLWDVRLRAAMIVHEEIVGTAWAAPQAKGGVKRASAARQELMAALNR